jgi:hypothetical protein
VILREVNSQGRGGGGGGGGDLFGGLGLDGLGGGLGLGNLGLGNLFYYFLLESFFKLFQIDRFKGDLGLGDLGGLGGLGGEISFKSFN